MPRRRADGTVPNWSRLCKLAAPQGGYFSAAQARGVGFSLQLLQYYIHRSLVQRTHRGIFHLAQHPRAGDEDLIALWLWSRREGIISHETALGLHELLDAPPARLCVTLPNAWRKRRVRPPPRAALFYADIQERDVLSRGPLLISTPLRALLECVRDQADGLLVEGALRAAVKRKLLTRVQLQRALRKTS